MPLIAIIVYLACLAAYIQHFIATWGDNLFLFLVGAFIPPVGIFHGFGIWLGIW